jgi:molybdopterin converting factor small subunit
MNITLKLYADLGELLPLGARANALRVNIPQAATPNQVIDQFRVPREQAHLVLVNGIFVDVDGRDAVRLNDGDTLAVWPPVAGG